MCFAVFWETYLRDVETISKSQSFFLVCADFLLPKDSPKKGTERMTLSKEQFMQYILQCSIQFLALVSLTTYVPKDSTELLCVCIQTSELGLFIILRVCFIYV